MRDTRWGGRCAITGSRGEQAGLSRAPAVAMFPPMWGAIGPEQVAAWMAVFSYPLVFLLLVACGLGAPLSEDLILITAGLVVSQGHGDLPLMVLTGFAGTVTGDLLLHRMGRRLGSMAWSNARLKRILSPGRVARLQEHFRRRGALTAFVARFLPGLRAPAFLVSGLADFPTRKFLIADALGALITAPLLTWLGFRFGTAVLGELRFAERWILLGALGLLAALAAARALFARRRSRRGEASSATGTLHRELGEKVE